MELAKRLIITGVFWLGLFILCIKACIIVDRKYKNTYNLTKTINLGFFRRFFIFSDRYTGQITWYVLIMNAMFYAFNIIFVSLFAYFIYKTAWGVDVWGYSTAALTFALMQFIIIIGAILIDFYYDFKTDKIRYGIKKEPAPVAPIIEEEDDDPYANYESNT